MNKLSLLLFILAVYAMLHAYIIYPVLLWIFAPKKRMETSLPAFDEEITIICAAYNEEKVIAQKIESTFESEFPKNKIRFLIGTDNCSDRTVEIIRSYMIKYPGINLFEFKERRGKINIINELCGQAATAVIVMTDANVFFKRDTLPRLLSGFSDNSVQMVCGNIVKRAVSENTVTRNELQYLGFENFIRKKESSLFNTVIGAEGGCYAIRREMLVAVPSHFNVDDFFITASVLYRNGKIIFAEEAVCFEDTAADTAGEFRRKKRIATGNFQNLFYFKSLLNPFSRVGFAYVSHKVLRWLAPFFYLISMAYAAALSYQSRLFLFILSAQLLLLLVPPLNFLLRKINIHISLLQSLSHFIAMNAALLAGFFLYCRGVKSSIWQPVKR